jgi:hypothetical protein
MQAPGNAVLRACSRAARFAASFEQTALILQSLLSAGALARFVIAWQFAPGFPRDAATTSAAATDIAPSTTSDCSTVEASKVVKKNSSNLRAKGRFSSGLPPF